VSTAMKPLETETGNFPPRKHQSSNILQTKHQQKNWLIIKLVHGHVQVILHIACSRYTSLIFYYSQTTLL